MLPGSTVGGEDALAQQMTQSLFASFTDAVRFEIRSQDGLDVLRFTGEEEVKPKRMWESAVAHQFMDQTFRARKMTDQRKRPKKVILSNAWKRFL